MTDGVDLTKLPVDGWEYESTGCHERQVPKVTRAEEEMYSRLSHKPELNMSEKWLLRQLHRKFSYRERFAVKGVAS